jgi:hypothetical protein
LRDQEVKQHLLICGDRSLSEALNQAMKLEVVNAAASTPATLKTRQVTRVHVGMFLPCPHPSGAGMDNWYIGSVGMLVTSAETVD